MRRTPMPLMALVGFLILAICGSGFVYVGFQISRFLRAVMSGDVGIGGISHTHIFVLVCAFFFISVALSFAPFEMHIKKHLVWFAWLLIGIGLYLLMCFLVSDLALLVGRLAKLVPTLLPRGAIIISACAVFAATACLTGLSVYNAKQIKHVSYEVTINKPSPLGSLGAVLISDTHLDYLNDEKWLAKIADEVNRQNPDIVFIAGDIFNNTYNNLQKPDESLQALLRIKPKYGIYGVPGNHDGGTTYPDMLDFLGRAGITMLQDEHIVIDNSFVVIGRADPMPIGGGIQPRKEAADVLSAAAADNPSGLPVIVIDHQPGFIDEYGTEPDLILAGHTHRGIFFPATVITQMMNGARNYGHSQKDPDSPHIIVTSGVGLWGPPFRLGSANEVVRIDIVFSKIEKTCHLT